MRLDGRKSSARGISEKKGNKASLMVFLRKRGLYLAPTNANREVVSIDFGDTIYESGLSGVNPQTFYNTSPRSLNKATTQKLLYSNQLVAFNLDNKYLTNPEQLWLIESLIGKQAVQKALTTKKKIDNQFVENLFKNAPFSFYLSADEAYLLSSDDELTQLDFGPLTKINAFSALQRFGLVALERAKEKTIVQL